MSQPPDWAERYIGIPYIPMESDCWHVFAIIQREVFGRNVPEFYEVAYCDGTTSREEVGSFIALHKVDQWTRIEKGQEQSGDGMLFTMLGVPMHIGVVCAPGLFIHCARGSNSCIERYNSGSWSRRIEGFYRYTE